MAYLFGGLTADGPSDELWEFDLALDSWRLLEPSGDRPPSRFGHTATWVDGVGLVAWSGQGKSAFFDDIWAYDPASNSWSQLPSAGAVPEARYGSCAALGPDGELWISHGFTEDSGRFADTRSYDFATGTWANRTVLGLVPEKRCLHDCFWTADDKLVLYAGQTTGIPALGDLWWFDPATAAWTRNDDGAPPRHLYALARTVTGAIVFGGGSSDGGYLSDAWFIDDDSVSLSALQVDRSPPARSGATLISDEQRDRFLLFGGQNDSGILGDLWELSGTI